MKLLNEGIEEDLNNFVSLANSYFNSFYCVEIINNDAIKSTSYKEDRKFFPTLNEAKKYYYETMKSLKNKLSNDNYTHIILSKVNVDLDFNEIHDEFINMD